MINNIIIVQNIHYLNEKTTQYVYGYSDTISYL